MGAVSQLRSAVRSTCLFRTLSIESSAIPRSSIPATAVVNDGAIAQMQLTAEELVRDLSLFVRNVRFR